jgi:hypothetical protein
MPAGMEFTEVEHFSSIAMSSGLRSSLDPSIASCAANVLLSLRERIAGRPLAEREEYIGRAVVNMNLRKN